MSERMSAHHWLIVDDDRKITGCHCGFEAPEHDCGYGDSVIDHIASIAWEQGASTHWTAENPHLEDA